MPNKYVYDLTFEDMHDEEDREVKNDCLRAMTKYFKAKTDEIENTNTCLYSLNSYLKSMTDINKLYLDTLQGMEENELKEAIIRNNIVIRK